MATVLVGYPGVLLGGIDVLAGRVARGTASKSALHGYVAAPSWWWLLRGSAQAVGLPVVATKVGGIPEAVDDGESAMLVPPRDADATEAALVDLLEAPEQWLDMGRRGRDYVGEQYDIEQLNDRLVRIYDRARKD